MPDVRIFKQTTSIFLAAQLLLSFGLCGGLCCVKVAELSAPQAVEQAAESDESLPPCHRKKAVEKKAQQTHSAQNSHSEQQIAASKVFAAMMNRNCCAMKRETPEGEPLPSVIALQIGKEVAVQAASTWPDSKLVFDSSSIPIQDSAIHSPPHTGFQLSLRI